MPTMHDDDETNWEWRNGKKILRDGGRTRVSLRDAARNRTGLITDGFGNVEFHKPGFRYADTSNHIRNRDANIDFAEAAEAKRRAYIDYQDEKENSWRNPGGDVGGDSRWHTSPSTGPAPVGATGSEPRDECREQSGVAPIEDSAASIRDRQHAHQQRMNKIYRDVELEVSSAWRTPAGPTSNGS
jgi:hypothetical protein